ncbi:hypothetical protein [Dactylosporangium salmoneum]
MAATFAGVALMPGVASATLQPAAGKATLAKAQTQQQQPRARAMWLWSQAALQRQLSVIDSGAQRYGTYDGIAVHDYDTWSRIR